MITLEVAKQHLRVVHTDEDPLIEAYLAAAHEHVQNEVGGEFTPDGLLVGGASLDAYSFAAIVEKSHNPMTNSTKGKTK